MRILEEFWYGNIEPTEYDTTACKELKEIPPFDYKKRGKTSGHHDGGAEGTLLPVHGCCP